MRLALALAALTATQALADESWDSDAGRIVYQTEVGDAAIFSFTHPGGTEASLVIPGLAGNYANRGTHDAYWIAQAPGSCGASLGFDGQSSTHWGRATLVFDKPDFPTSFTLLLGDCLDAPTTGLRAENRFGLPAE